MLYFTIGDLGEILIPGSDGVEGFGSGQAHDFIGFAAQRVASVFRAHGHGDDNSLGVLPPKRANRGDIVEPVARPSSTTITSRPSISTKERVPRYRRPRLPISRCSRAAISSIVLRAEFAFPDQALVDNTHRWVGFGCFGDRAEAEFGLPGNAQFADQKYVHGRAQEVGHDARHRHAAARQAQND